MRDEYSIVGPAIFVMESLPEMAEPVCHAYTSEPVEPPEVWIDIHKTWVRLDGQWVSGWKAGRYFAFRPWWLNRWKIRRAAKSWNRSNASSVRRVKIAA